MKILHQCPGDLASGGTEGIHNLIAELSKYADASVWYTKGSAPKQFAEYNCKSVTTLPAGFKGAIIFPEVWANEVANPIYHDFVKVVNWQGIDVYYWNTPKDQQLKFLKVPDVIHIAMSEYGMKHLRDLNLYPIKISDCINEAFFNTPKEELERGDVVLYNPIWGKLTNFQQEVMNKAGKVGIKFFPLQGYSRDQLINLFRQSKLYIDFGLFSGRERLPREAVVCGCCILTSRNGTAGVYEDNLIGNIYKPTEVDIAVDMIKYVLKNYDKCQSDFEAYRQSLRFERFTSYPIQVKGLYDEIFNHYTGVSII